MTTAGTNLSKGMQLSGSRAAEKLVPRLGTKPHYTCKTGVDVTEFHSADEPGEIRAERTHRCTTLALRLYANDQKDCSTGQGCKHGLRQHRVRHVHPICLNACRSLIMRGVLPHKLPVN